MRGGCEQPRPPRPRVKRRPGGDAHLTAFSNYKSEFGDHEMATVRAPAGEGSSEPPPAPGALYRATFLDPCQALHRDMPDPS